MAERSEVPEAADVLVVVDDWKGPVSGRDASPVMYLGRAFAGAGARGAELDALRALLRQAGASTWHASGDRARDGCLFTSPHFATILDLLGTADSSQYSLLRSFRDFRHPTVLEEWQTTQAAILGTSPYAVGFVSFVLYLLDHLLGRLPPGSAVRIVADAQSWLPRRLEGQGGLATVLVVDPNAPIRCRADVIVDKSAPDVADLMPFLGLVDSEAWAFGRLQSASLPNGETVRERMLRWQADKSTDEPVTSADVIDGQPDEVCAYWESWLAWHAGGRAHVLPVR